MSNQNSSAPQPAPLQPMAQPAPVAPASPVASTVARNAKPHKPPNPIPFLLNIEHAPVMGIY